MLRTESVHSNSITTMSVVTSATRTKEHTNQQQFIEWYVFMFSFKVQFQGTFDYYICVRYRYEFIKQTIVYINAQTITIACPSKCLYMDNDTSTLRNLIDSETNATMTFYG